MTTDLLQLEDALVTNNPSGIDESAAVPYEPTQDVLDGLVAFALNNPVSAQRSQSRLYRDFQLMNYQYGIQLEVAEKVGSTPRGKEIYADTGLNAAQLMACLFDEAIQPRMVHEAQRLIDFFAHKGYGTGEQANIDAVNAEAKPY